MDLQDADGAESGSRGGARALSQGDVHLGEHQLRLVDVDRDVTLSTSVSVNIQFATTVTVHACLTAH